MLLPLHTERNAESKYRLRNKALRPQTLLFRNTVSHGEATELDAPIYRTEPPFGTEESSPDKLAHSRISETEEKNKTKKKWSRCDSEAHFELQHGVLLIYT